MGFWGMRGVGNGVGYLWAMGHRGSGPHRLGHLGNGVQGYGTYDTRGIGYRGMGHMGNLWGTRGMGHVIHGQWGTGV